MNGKGKPAFTITRRTIRTPKGYQVNRRKVRVHPNTEAVKELNAWWEKHAEPLELPEEKH